jgi:hypothetical protein
MRRVRKKVGVSDALAGKTIKCRDCGDDVFVRAASTVAVQAHEAANAVPKFYISGGKIAAIATGVVFLICGLVVYFGPLHVWYKWEEIGPKAGDDVKDVVTFALQAYLSENHMYDPSDPHGAPAVDGDVRFIRPMGFFMPEKVKFGGKSNQGSYAGTYNTRTGDIEADILFGGYSVAGMVDIHKPTGGFHITGRDPGGNPEAEVDGNKLKIVYPPKRPEN